MISLFLLLALSSVAKGKVPVILIDYDNTVPEWSLRTNPFVTIDSDFPTIIKDGIKNSICVILFIEEKFSVEDISGKDRLGTPYANLHEGLKNKKIKFIPSVSKPLMTLKKIFKPRQNNVFFLSPGKKLRFSDSLKYLYIYFRDPVAKPRSELLRTHDLLIKDVYTSIRQLKHGNVLGIYTGKKNPIMGRAFSFTEPTHLPEPSVVVVSEGAIFSFADIIMSKRPRRSAMNAEPYVSGETWSPNHLTTTLEYPDFDLKFNFKLSSDSWLIESISLMESGEEVGRTALGVGAPWLTSYVCDEPLSLVNVRDGSSVTITKYKIEPRSSLNSTGGNSTCFSRLSRNCGPYYNSSILAGLFVAFLFLTATAVSVSMMFDCHSNDRFENPEQKSINVQIET